MKKLIVICVLVLLYLISPNKVSACSYWEWDVPVCAEYARASSVFIGTVKKIKKYKTENDLYRATYFDVEKIYKGINNNKMFTVDSAGMCSPDFKVGEKFVVFARRLENKPYLWIGMFEGTENIKNIEKDYLDYLDKVEKGTAETAIMGKIVDYGSVKEGTENLQVELDGENLKRTTTSDEKGRFKFDLLPTGKYVITVRIPKAKVAISYSPNVKKIGSENTENVLTVKYEIFYEHGNCSNLMIFTNKETISIP